VLSYLFLRYPKFFTEILLNVAEAACMSHGIQMANPRIGWPKKNKYLWQNLTIRAAETTFEATKNIKWFITHIATALAALRTKAPFPDIEEAVETDEPVPLEGDVVVSKSTFFIL